MGDLVASSVFIELGSSRQEFSWEYPGSGWLVKYSEIFSPQNLDFLSSQTITPMWFDRLDIYLIDLLFI